MKKIWFTQPLRKLGRWFGHRLGLQAAPGVNLQQFCAVNPRDDIAYYCAPFSVGIYTYATDGCIIVRVPRRADVDPYPEDPEAIEAIFEKHLQHSGRVGLPPYVMIPGMRSLARFGVQDFMLHYIQLIEPLPNLVVSFGCADAEPMSFRFDGGVGLLMPFHRGRHGPEPCVSEEQIDWRMAA